MAKKPKNISKKSKNISIVELKNNFAEIWRQAAYHDTCANVRNAKTGKPTCTIRRFREGEGYDIAVATSQFRENMAYYFGEIAQGKSVLLTPYEKRKKYSAILVPTEQLEL